MFVNDWPPKKVVGKGNWKGESNSPLSNDLIVSNIKSFFKNQWPNNHIDRSIRSGCFFTVKNRKNIFINSRKNFVCL